MEDYSERNLLIIQEAMQELGISDCEEIPEAIRLLKKRAQQKMHPTPPTSLTSIALARTEWLLAKRRARKSAGG